MIKKICILILLVNSFIQVGAIEVNNYLNGVSLIIQGEYKVADSVLTEAIRLKDFDITKLYYQRGISRYNQEKFSHAYQDFMKAAETQHMANLWLAKSAAILHRETDVYFYLERYLRKKTDLNLKIVRQDEAFKLLTETNKWFDFWQNTWLSHEDDIILEARYFVKKRRYEDAQRKLDILEPSVKKYKEMALLFHAKGDFINGMENINKALSLESDNCDLIKIKIELLNSESKKYQVIALLERYLELKPEDFEMQVLLMHKYYLNNNLNKAVAHSNVLEVLLPNNNEILELSAEIEIANGEYLSAIKKLNNLISKGITSAHIYKLRGKAYYNTGTYSVAALDFSNSLDIAPSDGETYYYYGMTNYMMDNKSKACYAFKKAYQNNYLRAMEEINTKCN